MEDVDEDKDEEEVVVFGHVGCAAVGAGAALLSAVPSAAAIAGRMEGISSGCGLRAGGWQGLAVTWSPGGPIRLTAVGGGGASLRSPPSRLDWAGLPQCLRACGLAFAGGDSSCELHFGAGEAGPGVTGVCVGGVCGSLGGLGVLWGVGLFAVGVCGLPGVWGGEGDSAGGSMASLCGRSGGWGRPV